MQSLLILSKYYSQAYIHISTYYRVVNIMKYILILFVSYCNCFSNFRNNLIKFETELSCNHDPNANLHIGQLNIFFYDFEKNVNISSDLDNFLKEIRNYTLDLRKHWRVFIPGFKSAIDGDTAEWTRNVIANIPDSYLIIVDYGYYTKYLTLETYGNAVLYSDHIGKKLAKLMIELRAIGFASQKMHLFGHSFGGVLLTYVGNEYQKATKEKIGRLTSVDPPSKCFEDPDNYLKAGDAEYVDMYHCTIGQVGMNDKLVGDVNFMFNKEMAVQPNCSEGHFFPHFNTHVDEVECGHILCYKWWIESALHPGHYLACNSYEDYVRNKCVGTNSTTTIAGFFNPGNVRGEYFASTVTGFD